MIVAMVVVVLLVPVVMDVLPFRAILVVAHDRDLPAEEFCQRVPGHLGGRVDVDRAVDAQHMIDQCGDEAEVVAHQQDGELLAEFA